MYESGGMYLEVLQSKHVCNNLRNDAQRLSEHLRKRRQVEESFILSPLRSEEESGCEDQITVEIVRDLGMLVVEKADEP